jgi:GNAT superfamily N-acetyltransferase
VVATADLDVALKDGTRVHIRPIRPQDDRVLIEWFRHLSPETVYQRFFTNMSELPPAMARHAANAHFVNRMAMVAESGSELLGIGRYERTPDPAVVELALLVADEWQNRGLGRILLREIMQVAGQNGIHKFRADVLAGNQRMLHLLSTETDVIWRKTEAGVTSLLVAPKK